MSKTIRIIATWESVHEIEVEDDFYIPESGAELHHDQVQQLSPENATLTTAVVDYDN